MNPDNGIVMMTGYMEGNISTFICNPGYELVGNETLTCQDDGQWSPLLPVCVPGMKNSNHSATLTVIFIRSVGCIHINPRACTGLRYLSCLLPAMAASNGH